MCKFKASPAQVGKRERKKTPASIKTVNAVMSVQHQLALPLTIFSVSSTRIRLWRLHNCSLKSCQHFPGALQAQEHHQPSLWSYTNTDIFRHTYRQRKCCAVQPPPHMPFTMMVSPETAGRSAGWQTARKQTSGFDAHVDVFQPGSTPVIHCVR